MPVQRVRRQNYFGSPCQSDMTILVTVEDLINMAMGPTNGNTINFKILQAILHIFARQLRMMEQHVEIQIAAESPTRPKTRPTSTEHTAKRGHRSARTEYNERQRFESKERGKSPTISSSDDEEKKSRRASPKDEAEKNLKEKEKPRKVRERDERNTRDEREKSMLAKMGEKEKAESVKSEGKRKKKILIGKEDETKKAMILKMDEDEKEKIAKMDKKEKNKYTSENEKEERVMEENLEEKEKKGRKDLDRSDENEEILTKMEDTEKERFAKMDENAKEKYVKEKKIDIEKAILAKMDKKEQEKFAKMDVKEKNKYLELKIREQTMLATMDEQEKKMYAKLDKKDKEKYISGKEKIKRGKEAKTDERKEGLLAKMDEKEKAEFAKMDELGKEKYLEEKIREESMLDTMDEKEKVKYTNMDETDRGKYLKEMEKRGMKKEKNEREGQEKEGDDKNKELLLKLDKKEKGKLTEIRDKEEAVKLAENNEKEKPTFLNEMEREERETSMLANMTKKEPEKFAKMDGKGKEEYLHKKERDEREKTMLAKMDEKERAKFAKMNEKGKEKYLNEIEMEKGMLEHMDQKEKMLFSKMDERGKENYLIEKSNKVTEIEKRAREKPESAKESGTRVGSIEVVTVSQFELLKAEVKGLQDKASPIPFPTMPDNQKLRQDIASGSASLSDTMQAMQLSARVQAAETAISQMAGILTALAAAGSLPMDVAEQIEDVMGALDKGLDRKSYGTGFDASKGKGGKQGNVNAWRESFVFDGAGAQAGAGRAAAAAGNTRPSAQLPITKKGAAVVCRADFDNALHGIRNDMTTKATDIATKTLNIANAAKYTATDVAAKLELCFELNDRVNELFSLVSDYVHQFAGFDAGVNSQMACFNEQMRQMRHDMQEGVNHLVSTTGSSETEGLQELYSRFEDLVTGMDITLHLHNELNTSQSQLSHELTSLLACVETLRDEKADRDEVLDGMQDKADLTRLTGLVSEKVFNVVLEKLERMLADGYSKFLKQEIQWMKALEDLALDLTDKSNLLQVKYLKRETEEELNKIHQDLILLAKALGDPKAALLTRQLSVGALCGPCRAPALQEATDPCASQPLSLPPLRCLRPVEVKSCEGLVKPPQSPQGERPHVCHRWAGGSHTLMSENVVRRQAATLLESIAPVKKYAGTGVDGRMYRLEGTLDPCMQCHKISSPIDLRMDGTGDSVKKLNVLINNNKDP